MNPFCASLPAQVRRVLCDRAEPYSWDAGDKVSSAQFISRGVYIVREGLFVTSTLSEAGAIQGINFAGRGDLVNLFSLYDAIDKRHDPQWRANQFATVVKASLACNVSTSALEELMRLSPSFSNRVMARLFEKLRSTIEYSGEFHGGSSVERVAALISRLDEHGVHVGELSHSEIGSILGLSRVSVTRAFSSLNEVPACGFRKPKPPVSGDTGSRC